MRSGSLGLLALAAAAGALADTGPRTRVTIPGTGNHIAIERTLARTGSPTGPQGTAVWTRAAR